MQVDLYPFTVQGLRHLADFSKRVGNRAEAVKDLREALAIARKYEIQGQLQQIEDALRELGGRRRDVQG